MLKKINHYVVGYIQTNLSNIRATVTSEVASQEENKLFNGSKRILCVSRKPVEPEIFIIPKVMWIKNFGSVLKTLYERWNQPYEKAEWINSPLQESALHETEVASRCV